MVAVASSVLIISALSLLGCGRPQWPTPREWVPPTLRHARRILYASADARPPGNGSKSAPFASIQAAVDAALSGDAISLAPGTYVGNVVLRSHTALVGAGIGATVLVATEGAIASGQGVADVVIEGVTLDGRNSAESGLVCEQHDSMARLPNTAIVIRDCEIANVVGAAIVGRNLQMVIERNSIHHVLGDGISLWLPRGSIIAGNSIHHARVGIHLIEGSFDVRSNTVGYTRSHGIELHSTGRGTIRQNRIEDAGLDGLLCGGPSGSSPAVLENAIARCTKAGVRAEGPSWPVLRGNHIAQCEDGVVIHEAAMADLGREDDRGANRVEGNRLSAVRSTSARTVPAVGNWWGAASPDDDLFVGTVDHSRSLTHAPAGR